MARRRRSSEFNVWPGFVDGLTTLLLTLMFVLSIFVVAQFYLGARLNTVKTELASKDNELARLTAQLDDLAKQLGLAKKEKDDLAAQVLALQDTIKNKETEIAGLSSQLAVAGAAVAASAEELKTEKALTDKQKSEIATLNAQLAALRKQLASLQEALEAAEAKDKDQKAQIQNLSQRLNAALARKVQELQEVRSRFFEALRKAIGDRKDVKVVGDRFVLESDILFPSCSAAISENGKSALDKLATALLEIQSAIPSEVNWVLRVDGHADATPLGAQCQQFFKSNLQLSTERAISVVEYLRAKGVPGRRMMATGSGSDSPLVAGTGPAALAQNRRIEFKLTER